MEVAHRSQPVSGLEMMDDLPEPDGPQDSILTVADLTVRIKNCLEQQFRSVWVAGEVSDLSQPRSGHFYFTLKDEFAQIRAVIWRSDAQRMRVEIRDGMQVVCRGQLDVYPPRGSYQLMVRHVEPLGLGNLERRLRQLKAKLDAEGLFDPGRKRPLPRVPRRIALVTSPTAAALQDFLEVLRRRWTISEVMLIPARVQGPGSVQEIVRAIRLANRSATPFDVIVLTRGGGSLEDLWSFNEERVVRAICDSDVPIISAIGHEIDVTLADLAADVRALTPSEAAERVVPSAAEVQQGLATLKGRLAVGLRSVAQRARSRLQAIQSHQVFRRPLEGIHQRGRRVDEYQLRMEQAVRRSQHRFAERTEALGQRLQSLSPLAVLGRGYSITERTDGSVVTDASLIAAGEQLKTRLAHGSVMSEVVQTQDEADDASSDQAQGEDS